MADQNPPSSIGCTQQWEHWITVHCPPEFRQHAVFSLGECKLKIKRKVIDQEFYWVPSLDSSCKACTELLGMGSTELSSILIELEWRHYTFIGWKTGELPKCHCVGISSVAADPFNAEHLYCVICMERLRNVLFDECHHLSVCSECVVKLDRHETTKDLTQRRCPICRLIQPISQIFYS